GFLRVSTRDHDARAGRRQSPGHTEADAAVAARHDRHPALEVEHGVLPVPACKRYRCRLTFEGISTTSGYIPFDATRICERENRGIAAAPIAPSADDDRHADGGYLKCSRASRSFLALISYARLPTRARGPSCSRATS